jgi:Swt1-like HEPN
MVTTNRDLVDRGMGHLARGLSPFVDKRMAAAFPDDEDWVKILAARNPSRYGAGQRYSLSDPRFLLRVVTEEWRVFRDQLSRVEQGFATELKDAGNRWAHGDPFSADDTYRVLDTMERLLTAIGAAEQASEVRSLRLDFQQSATGAATPPAGSHTARPGPPALERSERTTGLWSRVAHADVVRAIEEYDRLGQEQFLAKYGFGRATAYLLIYRGRNYDSKAILGVAYKFATGVRIGAQDFSGGVYGAAGVLRKLGFEVRNARDSAGQRAEDKAAPGTPVTSHGRAPATAHSAPQPSGGSLDGVAPERSLLVLTCSGRKESGGRQMPSHGRRICGTPASGYSPPPKPTPRMCFPPGAATQAPSTSTPGPP